MASWPRLLLLDAPTSGISIEEKFEIMHVVMAALRSRKVTVLFVEHDMEIVARLYRFSKQEAKPELTDVVYYPAECVNPREGVTAVAWLEGGMKGAKSPCVISKRPSEAWSRPATSQSTCHRGKRSGSSAPTAPAKPLSST